MRWEDLDRRQLKAARAMLEYSLDDVAQALNVSRWTVARGERLEQPEVTRQLVELYQERGIRFGPCSVAYDPNAGGTGMPDEQEDQLTRPLA
jgi:hypothetical protein